MERLIDQKTKKSSPQEKVNAHENKEGLKGLVTSFVGILLNERRKNRSDRKTRYKQIQDDLKEKKGNCQLKEEVLDRSLWKTRFRRCYGPVVRQNTE